MSMSLVPGTTSDQPTVAEFLDDFLEHNRVHAKSLISTFFGDVVLPIDGFTWVETIAAALEPLGVNERLVRTSLFRLREEGWVNATRSGRKSYYELTESAASKTRLAERLIYYRDKPKWDGKWTLVFLVVKPLDSELRKQLEQELSWIGFGPVTKHVWAHPDDNADLVSERIDSLGLKGKVICMRCENIHDAGMGFTADDRKLADMCSPISSAEKGYESFCEAFSPLIDEQGVLAVAGSDPQMLSLRLAMMDEFRRVILKDHHLPLELLPEDWAGQRAYDLCGKIYKQIAVSANRYYEKLQTNAGKIERTEPKLDYQHRFA